MSWPRWIREKVREFVTACTGADWPGRHDQAQRLLEELPEEGASQASTRFKLPGCDNQATGRIDKSALPFAPPTFPSRADRKAERNERMLRLRLLVLRRARGRCEFRCDSRDEPVHAHHVFGGAGRQESEGEYTLAAVCETCHGKCNASPAWAREQALLWASRMAGEAHLLRNEEAAAGFRATAELLEARIALAAAQAPATREDA